MPEKETVFSSDMKYTGVLNFREFYRFCYQWLVEDTNLDIMENKYNEKLEPGNKKAIDIKWTGTRKLTDYFKFEAVVEFEVRNMVDVEVQKEGVKITLNEGDIKLKVKGRLIRDWQGKFERGPTRKFFRSTYDKWIIPARVEQFEEYVITNMDEFLGQAKSWLALEGKSRHQP